MRSFAIVFCACLIVLAGCAGQDSASTPEPTEVTTPATGSTPTATPTASPTPTATEQPTPTSTDLPPNNPWQKERVVVTVYDRTGSDRNFTEPVGEAVEYWNENADTHSRYDVAFEYVPNLSIRDADLTVAIVDSVYRCGGNVETGALAGCMKGQEEVQVQRDQNDLQVRNTAIHEIGHTLDLGHDEAPQWIMASGADAGEGSIPDARDRSNPWNTTGPLKLAVGESVEDPDRVQLNLRSVADYYNARDEYRPEGMDLVVVDESNEAHVIIEDSSEVDYEFDGSSSVGGTVGLDYDADDELEQYTRANVYLHDVSPRDSDWHTGNWVGYYLGNSKDELPSRYTN